jgi:hypothetical protein
MNNLELQSRIDEIMSFLPKGVNELGADSKYLVPYIQHIPENLDMVQHNFLELCDEFFKTKSYTKGVVHRQGITGRFIDDSGNKPLYKAWSRFMCIGEDYKEWCQPYYTRDGVDIDRCTYINDKYPELIAFFRDYKLNSIGIV